MYNILLNYFQSNINYREYYYELLGSPIKQTPTNNTLIFTHIINYYTSIDGKRLNNNKCYLTFNITNTEVLITIKESVTHKVILSKSVGLFDI